jgi:hypothetical protein
MKDEEIIQLIEHFKELKIKAVKECQKNDYDKKVKFYKRMLKEGLKEM